MNRKKYLKPENFCIDIDAEDVIIACSPGNEIKEGNEGEGLGTKQRVFGWDDYEYDSFGNNN